MKKILLLVASLMIVHPAIAANHDAHYTNAAQCKAYYTKIKQKDVKRLNAYQQQMGLGMPMVVYSDKLSRINAKYRAGLKKCSAFRRT